MIREEQALIDALYKKIDEKNAKLSRVKWALESIRDSAYEQMNKYASEADIKLQLVDFIEKVMEG